MSLLILLSFLAVICFQFYLRLLTFQNNFTAYVSQPFNYPQYEYDYIVVGSGPAGSIVARRLAEDKGVSVLLLEAGSYGDTITRVPFLGPLLQDSDFDWQYRTVPQKQACLGLQDRVSHWPMGKGVGGTSLLNNMIYTRGHVTDYTTWFRDSPNFDYEKDILPYFRKLESYNRYDAKKSIVIATDLPFKSNISKFIIKAAENAAFPIIDSIESTVGFSYPKATLLNGQRWTSANQLLNEKKLNLHILSNSIVEKVLLRSNFEAYGASYWRFNKKYTAKASKGVILSAGAIGSPKILMLSGIGPKNHLESLGIKSRVDLPVGDNLQDHVTTGVDLVLLDTPKDIGANYILSLTAPSQYLLRGKGPFSTTGCELVAYFNLDSHPSPDLQFMLIPLGITDDYGIYLRKIFGVELHLWNEYFAKINTTSFTILPIVLHPKSRGTLRLRNKFYDSKPLIDPNYLSHQSDMNILIKGIKIIEELLKTDKSHGARLNNMQFPGCEAFVFGSTSYWECYIRQFTLSAYHPVGTCSLGEVVDVNFRVRGTNNLYVVDGSILPTLPSGNPMGAIMVVAEKAADVIKEDSWLTKSVCNAKEVLIQRLYC